MKTLLKDLFRISLFVFCSTLAFAQNLSVNLQSNTSCGMPNGMASASVDGETLAYSFKWYEGPDETGPLLTTQPVATNLDAGIYTVTATHNTTAEVLGPLSVSVLDERVLPVVSVQVSPHTSCALNNGSLTAIVDGPAADYTYAWYEGTFLSGPVLSTNPSIDQLAPLTYTVVVTHQVSGCQTLVSATVPGEQVYPTVAIELVSAYTSCGSPNGSLRAVPDGPGADYWYHWYQGNTLLGSGDQTITGLKDGIYSVVAIHRVSQCQSAWTTARVPDETTFPTVSINVLSELTSCTTPNGSLQAVAGGPATDYTFAWYRGASPEGTVLSTNPTLSQLSNDAYTVQVTHKFIATCKASAMAMIQDNRPLVSASVQVLSHVTSCTTPNGSLRAVPATGSASSYTYKWYVGTVIQGSPVSTSQTLSNRAAGVYTVVVRHKTTLCETIATGTLQDNSVTGGIAVHVSEPLNTCYAPGALTVTTQRPASEYAFVWFEGTTPEGPSASGTQTFWLMSPGAATVVVTHTATQCEVTITAVLPDERIIPDVSVTVLSNETSCTSPNGSLVATVAQGDPSAYAYAWFQGPEASGMFLSGNQSIDQLPAGEYSVMVQDGSSGCVTIVNAIVADEKTGLFVAVETLSNSTTCNGLPNGSLRAVTGGSFMDHTYAWYAGMTPGGPVISNVDVLQHVAAGVYTVVVTHNLSGCQVVASGVVQDASTMPAAYVEVISPNTSCTEPNGALRALVMEGAVNDYTYEWYEGWSPYTGPILSTGDILTHAAGVTYTVVITHKETFCQVWVSQAVPDECQPAFQGSARSGESIGPETEQDTQFSYYPNPTTGTLWIKGESAAGYIVLSDRNGNVIRRQNLPPSGDSFSIDLTNQPAGVYMLTFHSGVHRSSYQIMKK